MSEAPIQNRSRIRDTVSWVIRCFLTLLIFLFFVAMLGSPFLFELPFHFAFGWVSHARNSLPPLLNHWRTFLLPLGCLTMATVLIHRFANRWLAGKGSERRLRPAQTIAGIALLLSGSAAAIALSGIVHQTVWLMKDPWIRDSSKRTETHETMYQARQLVIGLMEFQVEYGRHPYSFHELQGDGIPKQLGWLRYENGKAPEPFILLHPGSTKTFIEDEPVIMSPVIQNDQRFVVGYGDWSVRTLPAKEFDRILSMRGDHEPLPIEPDE